MDNKKKVTFINWLFKYRSQGINRTNLCKKIGIDPKTFRNWNNGVSEPMDYSLKLISDYFKISMDNFSNIDTIVTDSLEVIPDLIIPMEYEENIKIHNQEREIFDKLIDSLVDYITNSYILENIDHIKQEQKIIHYVTNFINSQCNTYFKKKEKEYDLMNLDFQLFTYRKEKHEKEIELYKVNQELENSNITQFQKDLYEDTKKDLIETIEISKQIINRLSSSLLIQGMIQFENETNKDIHNFGNADEIEIALKDYYKGYPEIVRNISLYKFSYDENGDLCIDTDDPDLSDTLGDIFNVLLNKIGD